MDFSIKDYSQRENIEKDFEISGGLIRSAGKFFMEPVYAPFFWQAMNDGAFDDIEPNETIVFYLVNSDRSQFPELGDATELTLRIDSNGLIHTALRGASVSLQRGGLKDA